MRILTIDIGNTAVKGSIFRDDELLETTLLKNREAGALIPLLREYTPEGCICCSVGSDADSFLENFARICSLDVMRPDYTTPLPIAVDYVTPRTLGFDRVAAAVGASRYAGDALVIDAGTAMTLDIVAQGAFKGGNISPGLRLRFRSLNRFTSRLPLVDPAGNLPDFGYDTETALRSGVVRGIVDEIAATWRRARNSHPGLRLLLTGGDSDFLAPLLVKEGLTPEINHSLVGLGLVEIYNYNKHPES